VDGGVSGSASHPNRKPSKAQDWSRLEIRAHRQAAPMTGEVTYWTGAYVAGDFITCTLDSDPVSGFARLCECVLARMGVQA